jgi:bidirectional [NiFe] hydrogenase diaphorase subunit
MSEITLTIDGREVVAEEGDTVLEAAREAGIDIPNLCGRPDLTPSGACRLCTVEVEKRGRTRLVASCVYPAEDGLTVRTESPPVVAGRKLILEMLLARAPGVEVLRKYGKRYGVDTDKFEPEPNYCILCGLCVRYCAEVKGKCAIGFVGRGVDRQVMFIPEIAARECPDCCECFNLCPTGVLPSNYGVARVPHFDWPANPFRKDED